MLFNRPTVELLLVIAAFTLVMASSYIMFGIFDLIFLVVTLCGMNACWDRYVVEEERANGE
jgi:hypothetical protein